MSELFSQLGINGKMLLAQAVNFSVLLVVLTIFVYRPLLRVLEERRKKIELGVRGGEIAKETIAKAEQVGQEKIKDAEREAVGIIGRSQKQAEEKSTLIINQAEAKGEQILSEAHLIAVRRQEEEMIKLKKEAGALVKEAIVKTVGLAPEAVDDRLISEALNVFDK